MSKSKKKSTKESGKELRQAFALAQQRAAQAVTDWATGLDQLRSEERNDDIGAVYDVLVKGKPDPAKTLYAGIGRDIPDLSDTVGEFWSDAQDAGYLYGLAVGLALSKGAR